MGDPSKLAKNLIVSFNDEEGVDCGAIKAEFFSSLLQEMDMRLFEGEKERIPKKSWGANRVIAGMIIGHSLVQQGPPLSPAIYNYITTAGSEESVMQSLDLDMLLSRQDIPLKMPVPVLFTISLKRCMQIFFKIGVEF